MLLDESSPTDGEDEPSPHRLALQWLAVEETARVLVDDALTILWMNDAARRALDSSGELEVRDGIFSTYSRASQTGLRDFVLSSGREPASHWLRSEDKDGHYLFRAREVATNRGRRFFGLTFHRSGDAFRLLYADIGDAFQLTSAEERVVKKMLEGLTAVDIALQLSLSIETVRSHIRNLYAKIGVTSREGLFFALQAYRV